MATAADFAHQGLAADDEDAATWNLLGRVRVWLGNDEAMTAFARAAALRPQTYGIPHPVPRDLFAQLAEQALPGIPEAFPRQMPTTMTLVADLPDPDPV